MAAPVTSFILDILGALFHRSRPAGPRASSQIVKYFKPPENLLYSFYILQILSPTGQSPLLVTKCQVCRGYAACSLLNFHNLSSADRIMINFDKSALRKANQVMCVVRVNHPLQLYPYVQSIEVKTLHVLCNCSMQELAESGHGATRIT